MWVMLLWALGTLSEQLNPSAILIKGGEGPKLHEWLQTLHLTAVAHAQEKGAKGGDKTEQAGSHTFQVF